MTRSLAEWLLGKDDVDLRMYDFSEEHSSRKAWLVIGIISVATVIVIWSFWPK